MIYLALRTNGVCVGRPNHRTEQPFARNAADASRANFSELWRASKPTTSQGFLACNILGSVCCLSLVYQGSKANLPERLRVSAVS